MSDEFVRLTPRGVREAKYRRQFASLETLCRGVLSEPPTTFNRPEEMAVDIDWIERCLKVIKEIHKEAIDAER